MNSNLLIDLQIIPFPQMSAVFCFYMVYVSINKTILLNQLQSTDTLPKSTKNIQVVPLGHKSIHSEKEHETATARENNHANMQFLIAIVV